MEGTEKKSQSRVQSDIIETGKHGRTGESKCRVVTESRGERNMEDRHRHGDRKHRVTSSGEQRETDTSDERAIKVETRTRESV